MYGSKAREIQYLLELSSCKELLKLRSILFHGRLQLIFISLIHVQEMLDLVGQALIDKHLHGVSVVLVHKLTDRITKGVLWQYCQRLSA